MSISHMCTAVGLFTKAQATCRGPPLQEVSLSAVAASIASRMGMEMEPQDPLLPPCRFLS